MDTKWIKALTGTAKEQRKREVLGYLNAFDELGVLIEELKVLSTAADYDSPSWAFKQAHSNGYNQALERVINLINVKDKT